MAEEIKKEIKEVKAVARGIHISPRKVRLLAGLVANMAVEEALIQLDVLTKKAAKPVKKLVASAIANARHNFQIEPDRLYIKNLTADGGRVFFRYQPRAQGRAFPVRKRTSHINLVLGVSEKPLAAVPRKTKPETAPVHPEKIAESKPEIKEEPKKTSFWQRFKRKKAEDNTQVPPKQDIKGKHYTGFDRRGNM